MMTEKIREQIMAVRSSGVCNMLSIQEVQRAAFDRNFYELVCYIQDSPKEYWNFILTGEAPMAGGE